MQNTKIISEAGKRYAKLKSIRPLNTPERYRMYHSMTVSPAHSPDKVQTPTMHTISRQSKDSFLLRSNKETVINTNHAVNDFLTKPSTYQQGFSKVAFERIIGDAQIQDYHLPLSDSCNHRCEKANQKISNHSQIMTTRDTHKARIQNHNLNFAKQVSRKSINSESLPHYLKRQKSFVSTLDSEVNNMDSIRLSLPIKERKINNKISQSLDTHKALKRIRKFEDFIGHKYAQKLFQPKKIPECYDLDNSNQSLTKKSMSNPKGHVKFDRYQNQIRMRSDRIDPYWGMTINYEDTHQNPEWKDSSQYKTISFNKVSQRKPMQVQSKYPIRQTMQLRIPNNNH